MVDGAINILTLALVKCNKSFKKHFRKIVSKPSKQGLVYWSFVDLKQ